MRLALSLLILIIFALVLVVPYTTRDVPALNSFKKLFNQKSLPELFPYPVRNENSTSPPVISARSTVVLDAKSGVSLFEKDPDVKHFPASTTKLMTAIVALEKCSPNDTVSITGVNKEGTQMGLAPGDLVSVESLLHGMLIASGNDAAYALAYACSSSLQRFTSDMNQKAKELGMLNTNFKNPAGFDDPTQYSTSKDLAKLAKVAVANPLISNIVTIKTTVVTDATGNKEYYLENVNELLGEVDGLEGVKTGQTEGSLEVLLSKTTRDGNTIIVVILGSQDRFGETKSLIEWTYDNHTWIDP